MKNRLAKRLRSLRNWEFFNIFLFLGLFTYHQTRSASSWWLCLYALLVVCYILLQGTLYWHLKLMSIVERPYRLPPWFGSLFRRLQRSTEVLLVLYVPLAAALVVLRQTGLIDLLWSVPIALFAGLEYINYYHLQLMHDNLNDIAYLRAHRKLRRAPLATDLDQAGEDAQ